jgi:hypothetical protein
MIASAGQGQSFGWTVPILLLDGCIELLGYKQWNVGFSIEKSSFNNRIEFFPLNEERIRITKL